MGKEWDKDKGGRDAWIAWMAEVMKEALRCCRPGSHALIWALPRTSHWTGMALEDAGWQVRDVITHLFGSGFPKSTAIDKQIDKIKDRTLLGRLANEIKRARAESGLSLRAIGEKMQEATSRQYGAWYHRGGHMFFETGMSLPSRPEWEHFKHILPLREEFYSVYDEAEREVIGQTIHARSGGNDFPKIPGSKAIAKIADITAPATPEAAQWQGFGSALKPAVECWWLVRKPLSEKNIAANVLTWGCGGINIDATRVNGHSYTQEQWTKKEQARTTGNTYGEHKPSDTPVPGKRFPSNLLLSHDPRCIARGTKRVRGNNSKLDDQLKHNGNGSRLFGQDQPHVTTHGYADEHGQEEVPAFDCVEGCPVRVLGEQSGDRKSGGRITNVDEPYHSFGYSPRTRKREFEMDRSEGTAARYFTQFHDPLSSLEAPFHYFSKSSRRDRNSGLEGMPTSASSRYGKMNGTSEHAPKYDTPEQNTHPTCKSTSLMAWLCRLVGVPGGVILDPFAGSGSTLVACIREGFSFIGIEQEQEYVNIARARIAHAQQEARREESEGQEWECVEECPIKVLDAQSGIRKSGRVEKHAGSTTPNSNGIYNPLIRSQHSLHEASEGGASRYFQQFPPDPLCKPAKPTTRKPKRPTPSPCTAVSLWDTVEEEAV